ncbi:MAG: hypothetical protein CSB44_04025 [Gammaproteobacteria bacterium]|nr:MAG: hypothetical protein CSB44_04025 [Gammaproteobacteria bacterium]
MKHIDVRMRVASGSCSTLVVLVTLVRGSVLPLLVLVLAACSNGGTHETDAAGPAPADAPDVSDPSSRPDYSKILLEPAVETVMLDEAETARAWNASEVRVPAGFPLSGSVDVAALEALPASQSKGRTWPVVIWLHGCLGHWSGTIDRLNWLASLGFVVIAPDSFARDFYPTSCDPATFRAGLYRPVLQMRQIDATYALWRVRQFAWAKQEAIHLGGFSEGGTAAATLDLSAYPALAPRSRVIESWSCRAPWREYQGMSASSAEPVMTLVASNDPWYDNAWQRGDCGEYLDYSNGSESIVVDWTPLATSHELLGDANLRELVASFLLQGTVH